MLEIAVQLEKAREQLLDLSTRNRLLNIPQQVRSKLVKVHEGSSSEALRVLSGVRRKMIFRGVVRGGERDDGNEAVPLPDSGNDAADERTQESERILPTKLTPEALQRRLLSIYYDARTGIEEQGVNTLFLALGQLRWKDSENSDIDRFAPLVLVPVELERPSARAPFRLKATDEEPSDNLSLVKKVNEFGITAPPFEWSEEFDISSYFVAWKEAVRRLPQWEVLPDAIVLGFFSFAKFLMYRDLDPETWPVGKSLLGSQLVQALLGDGFPASGRLFADDSDLDELIPTERLSHVIDADSSQAIAIEEVRNGRHLVIQGPPGTGKSQTITNLIATAVLDGKKVLFVAEKLAALEVVKRRLDRLNLGPLALELHSHKANKRAVLQELERTLSLGRPRVDKHEPHHKKLANLRQKLNAHARIINRVNEPSDRSVIEVMGRLNHYKTAGIPDRHPTLPEFADCTRWNREQFDERLRVAEDLAGCISLLGDPSRHPWRGVRNKGIDVFHAEEIARDAGGMRLFLNDLVTSCRALAAALIVPEPSCIADLKPYFELAALVFEMPDLDQSSLTAEGWETEFNALAEAVVAGRSLKDNRASLEQRFVEAAWGSDTASIRHQVAAHGRSPLRILRGSYRKALADFRGLLRDASLPQGVKDRIRLLDQLNVAKTASLTVAQYNAVCAKCFGSHWKGEMSNWAGLAAIVDWVRRVRAAGYQSDFFTMASHVKDPPACGALAETTRAHLSAFAERFSNFTSRTDFDLRRMFAHEDPHQVPFAALEECLALWSSRKEDLVKWTGYLAKVRTAESLGLGPLVQGAGAGTTSPGDIPLVFEAAYLKQLYRHFLSKEPEIGSFDGTSHENVVHDFRDSDARRIALACEEVVARHYDGLPLQGGGAGTLGILRGEMKRKRGHMPIRKLVGLTGPAIQSIKPVFMMSPLSVAQFLEPGAVGFDLVIFDEASQVEPVDALGAIARAVQLVVVGDELQLPPTRFFSKLGLTEDELEEDEERVAGAADIESILGLALARGLHDRMLRWHYRSRHHSLIAVSNAEFYEHRLYIVPSPLGNDSQLGLSFHKVPDGTFDRGRSRRNLAEARWVASAITDHALNHPGQTLGVAAFSVSQRDAILDELERIRSKHPDRERIEKFLADHPAEPFFVKNLENVQGDERDVIMISIGYAPDEHGAFSMNFGPLNLDGGERRLNVLITRAKLRCRVFSSITADQIDLGRTKARGVAALKVFLRYAETGILDAPSSNSGGATDSPFEDSVMAALEKHGHTIHTQVGTAGFFIDLAIVDPNLPGRYLLGIECDGATYHSARSARERDRQRQAVLEDHGWTIHRIWSADWFQKPDEQLRKVLAAIEAVKHPPSGRSEPPVDPQPAIEREPSRPVEDVGGNGLAVAYALADFSVPSHLELHEVPVAHLAAIVEEILGIEAPIHTEEIITRVRQVWGLGRAGARIRGAVEQALQHLLAGRRAKKLGDFVTLGTTELRIRDRSLLPAAAGPRKPENLPPDELDLAICTAVTINHGVAPDELPGTVCRLLGFSTLGTGLREVIDRRIAALKSSQAIVLDKGFFRVAD